MPLVLEQEPYETIEQWAASRGRQIRAHFQLGADTLRPEGTGKPALMTDVAWNAAKAATLQPAFRDRFVAFLDAVERTSAPRGVDFIVWDAVRSLERQLKLYKRGRTDKGAKVTYTIASNHLWGCAIDLTVRTPGGGVSFDLPPWYIKTILPLAAQHGLQSLYLAAKIDPPHIQVPEADLPDDVRGAARVLKADFPGLF